MGRVGTTFWLTVLVVANGWAALGWVGVTLSPLLLSLPYYLIWVDSKKPRDQQFRFENSRWGKKKQDSEFANTMMMPHEILNNHLSKKGK